MPVIDLVIFDCDGVLIDSELISARMLVAELAAWGIDVDIDYVRRHFLGRSYPVVLQQIRKEFGLALPDRFEAEYRRRLLEAFRNELRIIPGVRDVLASLATPFCLATSSSPERLAMSLDLVGLTETFAGRAFTASQVTNGKPAPDLFLFAARQMGASPERCLVIEDSMNGVRAGLAAGMQVWQFLGGSHMQDSPPQPSADEAAPHRTFASFADFYHPVPHLKSGGVTR
ncbi:HAD family hydrolase [Tropicimonas sediminicola]|uniref:Haloacid dehalogenase superfamily, subfamily IA, variant 3 with third motif having DD or ED n=1 Tax=Tropicimonas sediminicola TaxID=1031541 RepID=A0A239C9G0_9RHOB|nr:HAD family hydrolase [Tropicimonas sediminicola]SNS16599.1 haloacid dehalogenase superfamily, subfamily IA, variant 3 with third motif having DD or ED [Tropicimonas sediminicola]